MKTIIENEINLLNELYEGKRLEEEFYQKVSHQRITINPEIGVITVTQYYLYQDVLGTVNYSSINSHYDMAGNPVIISEDEIGDDYVITNFFE